VNVLTRETRSKQITQECVGFESTWGAGHSGRFASVAVYAIDCQIDFGCRARSGEGGTVSPRVDRGTDQGGVPDSNPVNFYHAGHTGKLCARHPKIQGRATRDTD
jgi:hypothetical protein